MGRDKATITVGGETLAARAARELSSVAYPVLAIGSAARSGLATIDDPREGPLMAMVTGGAALRARAHAGPFLLLACDMPLVRASHLERIASLLAGADAVVPVVGGRDQPLCACYAQRVIDVGARVAGAGMSSMRELLAALENVVRIEDDQLSAALVDADTPEELKRILDGLA